MFSGEKFNTISHLIGTALALCGVTILLTLATLKGDAWKIVSFSIYGVMTVSLYGISTIYHGISGPWKEFFQRLDYIFIYLMIGGSYTPFTLITIRGKWGWTIFGIIWGMAFAGILMEIFFGKKFRKYSLPLYLLMGWVALPALKILYLALPVVGFILLLASGLLYGIGVLFFINDHKFKHGHGIWHLFVIAASLCEYICLLFYVV